MRLCAATDCQYHEGNGCNVKDCGGEVSEEILRQAGYSEEQIEEFREMGII